jgi:hypothetical protein
MNISSFTLFLIGVFIRDLTDGITSILGAIEGALILLCMPALVFLGGVIVGEFTAKTDISKAILATAFALSLFLFSLLFLR